jgi:hypothetical protein
MEQPMNSRDEEFDNAQARDEAVDEAVDELEQHGLALHEMLQDYMDEHDLSDKLGSLLLLNISVRMRMVGYALETEQPSASGLKMDLDRFQNEIGDCIRAAKKGANEFIEEAMVLREEMIEEDDEDELDGDAGDTGHKGGKGVPS